jgi:hypothetical protein
LLRQISSDSWYESQARRKQFFFKKKNQKTFARYTPPPGQMGRTMLGATDKSFLVLFFQKRTASFLIQG